MRCHDSHPGSATRKVNKRRPTREIVVHRPSPAEHDGHEPDRREALSVGAT